MGISSITRSNTDTNQLNMNTAIILLALVSCAVASYAPAPYHGPYHIPTVTADGFLLDEPAVAAAKANHFALYNQAAHAAGAHGYAHAAYAPAHYAAAPVHYAAAPAHYAAPHHQGYYGYIPTVTHDGFLLDTPEVAAAKANHFALYNEAAHAAAAAPDTDVVYDAAPIVHAAAPVVHAYAPAVAHVAAPHHVLPAATHYTHLGPHYAYGSHHGYAAAGAYVPADTPAVAHAKAEHFAAHAKALAAAH